MGLLEKLNLKPLAAMAAMAADAAVASAASASAAGAAPTAAAAAAAKAALQPPPPAKAPAKTAPDPAAQVAILSGQVQAAIAAATSDIAAIGIAPLEATLNKEVAAVQKSSADLGKLAAAAALPQWTALVTKAKALQTRANKLRTGAAAALNQQKTWAKKSVDDLKKLLDAQPDQAKTIIGPQLDAAQKRLPEIQKKLDAGDFKAVEKISGEVFFACTGATKAINAFAADFPAYKVERDKAEKAIDALRKHAQAKAIAAELRQLDAQLKEADAVAGKANTDVWQQAAKAVKKIPGLCAPVKALADKLASTAAKVPVLTKKFEDEGLDKTQAAKLASYAHKLLVQEECSDEDAVKMAKDANGYMDKDKMDETDAIMSSRVKRSLVKGGVKADQAEEVGRNLRTGGTSSADDAKALGKDMAKLPKGVLENLNKNGITTECCRGTVTDAMPELAGVHPTGWPADMSWDSVPGLYDPASKKVMIGTIDSGGKRKVPGPNEGPAGQRHGAANLVGHEGGHAFDASDGDLKSQNAEFLKARADDVALGDPSGMHPPRDNYFLMASEVPNPHKANANTTGATSETFAESFAMHVKGGTWEKGWPKLKAFWSTNPWKV
jgi:hypothetical protein